MTRSSATRHSPRGLLWLGAAVAALLVMLTLAGSAHAAEPVGPETQESVSSEPVAEQAPASPLAEETTKPPDTEPAPEAAPEQPPAPPATEEAPAPPATEPVSVEEPAAPPATEPVAEEPPPARATEPVAEETSTHATSPVIVDPHSAGAPVEGEGEGETENTPESPGAPVASPTAAAPGELNLASSAATSIRTSLGVPTGKPDEPQGENPSCALSGLGAFATGSCSTALFGVQIFLPPSAGGLAASTVVSQATTASRTVDGDHGGSTAENRPAGQAPGPAPGGASGGSAVGGSGVACSSCLTLAGLLRLSDPRAMRRLRLSCEPWLTACFVLIPERPG